MLRFLTSFGSSLIGLAPSFYAVADVLHLISDRASQFSSAGWGKQHSHPYSNADTGSEAEEMS